MKYSEEQVEQILDKVSALLDEYGAAESKFQDDQDRKHWDETYGERLGAYSDKLKTLNGDDFDIIDEARKEHKDSYSDVSEDDYVNALEENIKKVIARVWPEMPEEKVEEVAEQVAENADEGTETTVTSVTAEPITEESETKDETEEEEDVDPVKADYDELSDYISKMPKRG